MILKKLKYHISEISKRIHQDGLQLVHINHAEPKRVELNYYESYMTSGVMADHLKLIIHHADAKRIRDAKTDIRHGYSYSRRGKTTEAELRVPCTDNSICFAFFYKKVEVPYVRVTSRLAGSHYPDIDIETYMSPDELRIKLNEAIATNLKGNELLTHLIENIAKAPSTAKEIKDAVIERKNELKVEFDSVADEIFGDFESLRQDNPEVVSEIVDAYRKRANKLIDIECKEEDTAIKKLEAEIQRLRTKRSQKIKALLSKVNAKEENLSAVNLISLRDEGREPLEVKLRMLCKFYIELPETDKPLVISALKVKIREMIDVYNSYSEYKFDEFSLKHICSYANITL